MYEAPLSLNSLGRCATVIWSSPDAAKRQIERGGDVVSAHRGAELPGDDEAGEVVEHGREIIPAPAGDLQVGEVGLPELVGRRRLVLELGRRLDDDVGRAGDQVMRSSAADTPTLPRRSSASRR
jgi:hypothetical protein